jgi:hypothetical protein
LPWFTTRVIHGPKNYWYESWICILIYAGFSWRERSITYGNWARGTNGRRSASKPTRVGSLSRVPLMTYNTPATCIIVISSTSCPTKNSCNWPHFYYLCSHNSVALLSSHTYRIKNLFGKRPSPRLCCFVETLTSSTFLGLSAMPEAS